MICFSECSEVATAFVSAVSRVGTSTHSQCSIDIRIPSDRLGSCRKQNTAIAAPKTKMYHLQEFLVIILFLSNGFPLYILIQ